MRTSEIQLAKPMFIALIIRSYVYFARVMRISETTRVYPELLSVPLLVVAGGFREMPLILTPSIDS